MALGRAILVLVVLMLGCHALGFHSEQQPSGRRLLQANETTGTTGTNSTTADSNSTTADSSNATAQPEAPPATTERPPAMPYDLDAIVDLDKLFEAHRNWQVSVLERKQRGAPTMRCQTGEGHGLGNRVPGVITAYALALMTGRIFLLESTLHDHIDPPMPSQWSTYAQLYDGEASCRIGHFTRLADPQLQFCDNPNATVLVSTSRWDYDLPMLQVNPTLQRHFDKFFPDGDVFHQLSQHLFRPKQVVLDAMQPYADQAAKCIVGMHLRTRKPGTSAKVEQFAAIARAVARKKPGTIFVAADARVFEDMVKNMPGRLVWWSKLTDEGLNTTTHAGNPGTELSAFVDLMLLAKCKYIVLTPSSSIGTLAAGYAGIPPVYATHGHHKDPFYNPWFWGAVSSEPCFCKAMVVHRIHTNLTKLFREEHPLWMHHSQCHFDPQNLGWPAPEWEMCPLSGVACRE